MWPYPDKKLNFLKIYILFCLTRGFLHVIEDCSFMCTAMVRTSINSSTEYTQSINGHFLTYILS
jgi:hypothetical protein